MSNIVPIRHLPDEPLRNAETMGMWLASLDVDTVTTKNYAKILADARAYFAEREIKPSQMMLYRRHLQARGLAASSVNAYMGVVKHFCNTHYDPSPADMVKVRRLNEHSRLALSRDEAAQLLSGPCETPGDFRDRAVVALALICGLRAAEVTRLEREDYTTEGGQLILRVQGKGKHSKSQVAAIPPALAGIIDAWLVLRPESQWLFCGLHRGGTGGRLSVRSVSAIGRRALDAIGLTHSAYTFHALRHTAACLLLDYTDDYARAQTLLRHASIDTTRIYTHSVARRRRLANPPENLVCDVLMGDDARAELMRDLNAIAERMGEVPAWQNRLNALIREFKDE